MSLIKKGNLLIKLKTIFHKAKEGPCGAEVPVLLFAIHKAKL